MGDNAGPEIMVKRAHRVNAIRSAIDPIPVGFDAQYEMKIDDALLIAPPVGVAAGVISYFVFDTSVPSSVLIAASIGLSPFAVLAVIFVVGIMFLGGFNNDRPPCSCGECSSNEYEYDDVLTRQRKSENGKRSAREWCYRCPKCDTMWLARDRVYYRMDADRHISESSRFQKMVTMTFC